MVSHAVKVRLPRNHTHISSVESERRISTCEPVVCGIFGIKSSELTFQIGRVHNVAVEITPGWELPRPFAQCAIHLPVVQQIVSKMQQPFLPAREVVGSN